MTPPLTQETRVAIAVDDVAVIARQALAAGLHHRAAALAVGVVDVMGTHDVALQVLPSALVSFRAAGLVAEARSAEERVAAAKAAQAPALAAITDARNNAASTPAAFAAKAAAAAVPGKGTTKRLPALPAGGGAGVEADAASLFLENVSKDYSKAITLAKQVGDKATIMQSLLELGDVKA